MTPDPKNDELNAEDFKNYYEGKPLMEQIHLIPSVTFPNLQQPENNSRILEQLKSKHQVREKYKEKKYRMEKKMFTQGVFGWAGEINVFKHALAANGFFANGERVSVDQSEASIFNCQQIRSLYLLLSANQKPVFVGE